MLTPEEHAELCRRFGFALPESVKKKREMQALLEKCWFAIIPRAKNRAMRPRKR